MSKDAHVSNDLDVYALIAKTFRPNGFLARMKIVLSRVPQNASFR